MEWLYGFMDWTTCYFVICIIKVIKIRASYFVDKNGPSPEKQQPVITNCFWPNIDSQACRCSFIHHCRYHTLAHTHTQHHREETAHPRAHPTNRDLIRRVSLYECSTHIPS